LYLPLTQHVLCKTEGSGLNKVTDKVKAAFQAHSANPGPVIHDDFKAQEEGTKEERMAKAREMNK
jgi:hypothetical protein